MQRDFGCEQDGSMRADEIACRRLIQAQGDQRKEKEVNKVQREYQTSKLV
jgi:hypothetical protein